VAGLEVGLAVETAADSGVVMAVGSVEGLVVD
jgi:hypothetical protein